MRVRIAVCSRYPTILYHNVDELSGDNNDLLYRLAADMPLNRGIGENDFLHRLAVRFPGYAHVGAFLAVHLHDELDLVLDQGGRIRLRPWSCKHVIAEFELPPQIVRYVRNDRGQYTQQDTA